MHMCHLRPFFCYLLSPSEKSGIIAPRRCPTHASQSTSGGRYPARWKLGGNELNQPDELMRENEALRERLARFSEASLRITEDLDFDTVMQGSWTPPGHSPAPATA